MLEGLEISEISYSQIDEENRFDSEYFQKKFILCENYLTSKIYKRISEKFKVTDGEHGSVIFQENGVKYLTAENIKKGYVDISKIRYVNNDVDIRNARARVCPGDILISIKGTLGEIAIAEEWLLPANMNRDVANLKPITKEVPSEYVALFLMSTYGNLQSIRGGSGGVQQMITLERLRKFIIPSFSKAFYAKISELYKESQRLRISSQKTYTQAETFLLETIGLKNFQPSTDPINLKSYKESFVSTGRLDAEYYQKKYEVLENHFNIFERKRIGDFISYPVSSGVTPKAGGNDYTDSNSGIPFIRAVDLNDGQVTTDNFIYIKPYIHNGILKRTQLKQGDVLFSIAGTVGRAALFDHTFQANINQAVSILRFNDKIIKRLYLIVFFNSEIGKEFVSKYSRQGLQTNLNLAEVTDLRIPIIDYEKQQKIADLVEESFSLKKQSEQLLEKAKSAVEIAIEQNEQKAIEYINS